MSTMNSTTIAVNLRKLRDKRGWSQTQLAERSGLRHGVWISQIERGARVPKVVTLERLAKALGVRLDQLVKE